ncbi:MAG: GNAT family N-acetyltransferase, partial [Saprospiraceae bacterium]|nr:GNAT family N-acetyltransferase [Saprospiraceae bacterium]
NYGFERLDLHHIKAFTHRHNLASRRLLEKSGFVVGDEVIATDHERVIYDRINDARGTSR